MILLSRLQTWAEGEGEGGREKGADNLLVAFLVGGPQK